MAISYIPEQKPYKNLTPFKRYILQSFPWIDEDFDALTNKQLLAKIIEYLNDVIANGEILQENVESLYNAFIELENYVNNFFDTTDFQELVNNKLDEMAESGQLQEIIENIIDSKNYGMKINSNRLYRKLVETGDFYKDLTQSNYYSHANGFCMIDENTIAISMIEGSHNYLNNNAKIQVIDITSGTIVKEVIGNFGHANDLAYNKEDNLLYVAGCSTYTGNGTLIENNRLFILNYDNLTIVDTIEFDFNIAGVSYDKITKKLYVNFHSIVYEINKTDYSIIKTINLENVEIYGGVGQTVKIENDIIYKITAFPNMITIFNINGEYTNTFAFNDFMDELYYIGELEGAEIIGDDIYFMSDNHNMNRSPLAMIQVGKTSLTRNIQNNNAFVNNAPYGNLTIYVDNSTNNLNPNGSDINRFKELVEAIMFLNSPTVQKFNVQITLINNNIEYYGCMIQAKNLRYISTSNATIGTLLIKKCDNLTIERTFFKGTIANYPNVKIENSSVSLYRPNAINNNTGSTYAIDIDNSNVQIFGYNVEDTFDGLFIHISGSSNLENNTNPLNNIIKENAVSKVEKMVIYKGTSLYSTGDVANYTTSVPNIRTDQFNKYKYINFVVNKYNAGETIKLKISGNEYRVNSFRLANAITDGNIFMYLHFLTFTDSEITGTYIKQIKFNPTNNTSEIKSTSIEANINEIYLSDN